MLCISIVAGLGFSRRAGPPRGARTASRRAFWKLFALGLLSWTPRLHPVFRLPRHRRRRQSPAAWSQIGFLLAYPFWYRALWMLRQPALDESRRERLEALGIELVGARDAFVDRGRDPLGARRCPTAENVALLVPVALDLLLLAALYNAVRRSPVTRRDRVHLVRLRVHRPGDHRRAGHLPRHPGAPVLAAALGPSMVGYMLAMAPCSPRRAPADPRHRGRRPSLGPSKTILAAIGLALSRPGQRARPRRAAAAGVARRRVPLLAPLRPPAGRTASRTPTRSPASSSRAPSPATSPVSSRPPPRANPAIAHGGGPRRFGRWNAQNGYGAGDALLSDLASRLEALAARRRHLEPPRRRPLRLDRHRPRRLEPPATSRRSSTASPRRQRGRASAPAPPSWSSPTTPTPPLNAMAAAEEGLAAGQGRASAASSPSTAAASTASTTPPATPPRSPSAARPSSTCSTTPRRSPPCSSPSSRWTTAARWASSRSRASAPSPSARRTSGSARPTPSAWASRSRSSACAAPAAARATIPEGAYLSVNMSPDAILSPEMERGARRRTRLEGLVIEITEHDAVRDYARLASRLADYRGRGAKVAIDDAGAGHASMRHVTQLAPDYIKIDRSLIHDIHLDHAKRALVRSMVTLEKELGARVVAEGIESTEELRALRELGVPLGQGYLLARPHRKPTPAPWSSALLELSDAAPRLARRARWVPAAKVRGRGADGSSQMLPAPSSSGLAVISFTSAARLAHHRPRRPGRPRRRRLLALDGRPDEHRRQRDRRPRRIPRAEHLRHRPARPAMPAAGVYRFAVTGKEKAGSGVLSAERTLPAEAVYVITPIAGGYHEDLRLSEEHVEEAHFLVNDVGQHRHVAPHQGHLPRHRRGRPRPRRPPLARPPAQPHGRRHLGRYLLPSATSARSTPARSPPRRTAPARRRLGPGLRDPDRQHVHRLDPRHAHGHVSWSPKLSLPVAWDITQKTGGSSDYSITASMKLASGTPLT